MTKEPTSRLSGRLCSNPKFQRMLGATNPDDAAARVRQHCGIASRRELDWDKRAARLFHELRRAFAYGQPQHFPNGQPVATGGAMTSAHRVMPDPFRPAECEA